MNIFIIAATGRCGSTLLMRLLQTHPDIWMWGESEEIFRGFFELEDRFRNRKRYRRDAWKELDRNGVIKGFYANLLPRGKCGEVVKSSINHFFKPPGLETIVGCKFILLTPDEALRVYKLFPDAKYLLLHPVALLTPRTPNLFLNCADLWF